MIAQKNLGIESVKYDDLLRSNNFKIMKNHFADNIATSPSLNSILNLDTMAWRYLPKNVKPSFFAGRNQSPLATIFKNNGYKVSTGYYHQYLGSPGKHVDEYYTFRSLNISSKIFFD